ncbi:MAG: hypothetical protein AMS24_04320 [Chlamydiae bacterium SM23_39]|nr:MAG: hypothetical protein AMS24_04320 [Chlamydiae bacterium SM23_39]
MDLDDTTKLFMYKPSLAVIYLGDQSGLPQASLDFRTNGRYRNICPFAEIVSTPKFRFKLECGIHEVKPLACRISPLGRFKNLKSGENFYFIHKPAEDCCCINSNKRIRILDYIRDNALGEYFENRDKASELYPLLFNTPSEFKYIAGFMMFNFDVMYLSQRLNPNLARPKSFDILVREIRKLILEYKQFYLRTNGKIE